eukprot:391844_1
MSTRKHITNTLQSMGYETNYINRSVKVHEKNYGTDYNIERIIEILVRLQSKDKMKTAPTKIKEKFTKSGDDMVLTKEQNNHQKIQMKNNKWNTVYGSVFAVNKVLAIYQWTIKITAKSLFADIVIGITSRRDYRNGMFHTLKKDGNDGWLYGYKSKNGNKVNWTGKQTYSESYGQYDIITMQ